MNDESVSGTIVTEYIGRYFVWQKNGHKPRHAHESHESAVAEANRLARLNPGKKFIVQQFFEKVSYEPAANPATEG